MERCIYGEIDTEVEGYNYKVNMGDDHKDEKITLGDCKEQMERRNKEGEKKNYDKFFCERKTSNKFSLPRKCMTIF